MATRLMLVYSSPFFDVLLNGPFKKENTIHLNMTRAKTGYSSSFVMLICNVSSFLKESSKSGILNLPEGFLIEILSNHGLKCTEEDVWKLILTWNRANNKEPSLALLSTVRFGRMDIQFFRSTPRSNHGLEFIDGKLLSIYSKP